MSTVTLGLKSLKVGDIAADGGMGTTLAALGLTAENTCSFVQEEGTTTEFFAEEVDAPVAEAEKAGLTKLNFSILDADGATLQKIFGGEYDVATKVWSAPRGVVTKEQSIEVTPKQGLTLKIPRASLKGRFNSQFSKNGLFQVELSCTVLTPTKEGEPPFTTTDPA